MLYRTALLEFAAMLKVGTAALRGLADQEGPTSVTEEVAKLLRQADDIADRLSTLGGKLKNDAPTERL